MFRKIDACYFLSDTRTIDYLHQDTTIQYLHRINNNRLDLRTTKHLIIDQYNNPIECSKFLDHVLVFKDIVKNEYERSIVSDFIFDTDVIAKVSGLDFVFNRFNVLSYNYINISYIIDLSQAETILKLLPYYNKFNQKNYFYEFLKSIFIIRDNFNLDIFNGQQNIPQDTWSYVFN